MIMGRMNNRKNDTMTNENRKNKNNETMRYNETMKRMINHETMRNKNDNNTCKKSPKNDEKNTDPENTDHNNPCYNNNQEFMYQLACEMRGESGLRPLCMAALLYAGRPKEAEAMRGAGGETGEMTTQDRLALLEGYDKLDDVKRLGELEREFLETPQGGGEGENAEGEKQAKESKAAVVKTLLRIYQRRGAYEKVEGLLGVVTQCGLALDPVAFCSILRHRTQKAQTVEELNEAEQAVRDMGYEFDIAGYSILVSAYARLTTFGDRASEEIMLGKVDTLLGSIEARLKHGDPDLDVSVSHLRAVIRGYGAAGKAERMREAWKRMQFRGLSNDTRVYNEMVKWYSLMGSVKDVLDLKEHMKESEVYPDAQTYTWIFRSLGKYYPRQVAALYEEIQSNRVRPDLTLYTTMLGVFGDLRMEDKVKKIVSEMQKREEAGTLQPSPFTYAVLMRLHSSNLAKVEELFAEAQKKGVGDFPHVITIYLHCLTRANEREKINTLLQSWPTWHTNVYNVLIAFHARHDERDKVFELLDKMKTENVEYNHVTYGTLITVFGRWKDTPRVLEVMEKMKTSGNSQLNAHFYSILASTYSRLGDKEGVNDAWEDLQSSRLYPDTEVYNTFLALYGKQHNVDKMQHVLDNMLKNVPPNPLTSSTVVDMLGKAGKISDMEQLVGEMKNHPDMCPTSVTYHQIMNAYAKTADVRKMEHTRAEMLEKGYTENAVTYNILSDGYGRAKRYEQLGELVQERVSKGIPMEETGVCVLVTSFARARMIKDVNKTISLFVPDPDTPPVKEGEEKSEEKPPTSPSVPYTNKLVWTMIDAYCRCGDAHRMEQWVRRLHHGTIPLKPSDRSSLIGYYGRVGAVEKMEEMANELKKADVSVSYAALNSMARTYAKAGKFENTIEVLHRLRDKKQVPDASTSLMLSGLFLKAGLQEQAQQVVEWRKQYAQSYADEIEQA